MVWILIEQPVKPIQVSEHQKSANHGLGQGAVRDHLELPTPASICTKFWTCVKLGSAWTVALQIQGFDLHPGHWIKGAGVFLQHLSLSFAMGTHQCIGVVVICSSVQGTLIDNPRMDVHESFVSSSSAVPAVEASCSKSSPITAEATADILQSGSRDR